MPLADQNTLRFAQDALRVGTEFERVWQDEHIHRVGKEGQSVCAADEAAARCLLTVDVDDHPVRDATEVREFSPLINSLSDLHKVIPEEIRQDCAREREVTAPGIGTRWRPVPLPQSSKTRRFLARA